MIKSPYSYADLEDELGESWNSDIVLNTADKLNQIAKNTKSEDQAKQLCRAYLRQKKRELSGLSAEKGADK